jgi:hypothetical protein
VALLPTSEAAVAVVDVVVVGVVEELLPPQATSPRLMNATSDTAHARRGDLDTHLGIDTLLKVCTAEV